MIVNDCELNHYLERATKHFVVGLHTVGKGTRTIAQRHEYVLLELYSRSHTCMG